MFDVGFWELCLIGLISLLVIGPERLPKVARIAGYWIGKVRSMTDSVKQEIKEELREEEIRQLMKQQSPMDDFKHLVDETAQAADVLKTSVEKIPEQLEADSNQTGRNEQGKR